MGIIRRHEKERGTACYGVANIKAFEVRETLSNVKGAPTRPNPFHADVLVPPDGGKDFLMDIGRGLADRSKLVLFR